ncbi:MAG: hypothetical protein V5A51_07920 [Bacteroidales bacterium]
MTEEIKQWLSKGKPYEEGLMLLNKYHKNRHLRNMLARTYKPGKLERELRKISKLQQYRAKTKPQSEKKPVSDGKKQLTEVLHNKSIKYKDLPKILQKVYDETKKLYKERASYHEKAKLLTKQGADKETIGNLVQKIKEADQKIRVNWEKIDNYDPNAEETEQQQSDEPINFKRISANRKYISSNKKKLQQDPEKWRPKIQQRVDELLKAGETFNPNIVEELKAAGIKI